MLQFGNTSRTMETRDHSKNGASLKSQMSKRNLIQKKKVMDYFKMTCWFILFSSICSFGNLYGQERRVTGGTQATQIIGSVTTTIYHHSSLSEEDLKQRAHAALMQVASNKHNNAIDVENIRVVYLQWRYTDSWGSQEYSWQATGQVVGVVTHPNTTQEPIQTNNSQGNLAIDGAVERAVEKAIKNIPTKSSIVLGRITTPIVNLTDHVNGELSFLFVDKGFRVVKNENDADYRVVGRVDGEGSNRRLRLNIVDTETGDVIGAVSEPI